MADRKITDLTALAAGSQATGDLVTVVDVSEAAAADKNKKMTMENLFKGIPGDVGIGTSAPSGLLHLAASSEPSLYFEDTGSSNTLSRVYKAGSALTFNSRHTSAGQFVFNSEDSGGTATERMRIDGSGNVGIGTSSPADELHINATSANVNLRLTRDTNTGARISGSDGASPVFIFETIASGTATERMRIDSSGRLLLGLTSGRAVGGGTQSLAQIETTSQNGLSFVAHRGTNTSGSILILGKSRGTSVGSNTVVANGDELGALRFAGADGTDVQSRAASIAAFVDGTPGSNDMPGRLVFNTTADGASSPTERLRIDSSGQLGVGVSSPVAQVQINSDKNVETNKSNGSNYHLLLKNDQDDNGEAVGLGFSISTNATVVGASILHERDGGGSQGSLQFLTNGGSNTVTERMRIDSSGDVGIGTSSPSAKLDVNGDIRISNGSALASTASGGTIQLQGGATFAGGNILLGGGTGNNDIRFRTTGASDTHTESARINSNGLTFNGDTAAANALDDYEEGTWTPTLAQGVTSPGYTNVGGTYIKIGDCVTFTLRMRVSSGTNNSSQVAIGGLPFSSSSTAREGGAFFNYRHDLNSGSAGPFMHISQGSTQIIFYNNIGGSWIGTNGSGIVNRTLHIQGHYFV